MTLLAISFHSTRLRVIRSRWQAEKREKPNETDAETFAKSAAGVQESEQYSGGTFIVFDWEKNQVVWQIDVDTAAGFCWHDGRLFLNRLRAGEILVLDGHGHELQRISHKCLNDLHTIVPTSRGFLLTSTGTDSIIEIDCQGNVLYEWCALDHGYQYLPFEQKKIARVLDRSLDQRYMTYPTNGHTTHVNSARFTDSHEDVILATLFHQGTVIAIDRKSGHARTLVNDLSRPHDIRPLAQQGWLLSNTGQNQTLILNDQWEITHRIMQDFDWVQCSAPLADGSIVIGDTNHHRLVRAFPADQRPHEVRLFPTEWRIFLIEEVPEAYADFFQHPIATPFL